MKDLKAKLVEFGSLPKGWDGYDGSPASKNSVKDALKFLEFFPTNYRLPHPQISPLDGEIGLYRHDAELFYEIGFIGDGSYSYYIKLTDIQGTVIEFQGDDCAIDDIEPLRQWLEII